MEEKVEVKFLYLGRREAENTESEIWDCVSVMELIFKN
jgi:hypothetical protein